MGDLIIAAIRRQLKTKVTDLGRPPRAGLVPGNAADIAADEEHLRFRLPSLLKQIYAEIGNGGFGPGYGLIGLTNGVPDDTGKTAVAIYDVFRSAPELGWSDGLLPICHWGCAIYSCVDCRDPAFRMRIFDPNVLDGDDWTDAFFEGDSSFEDWIRSWASGVNLWDAMYGDDGHIARIISTRRKRD
ncbi:SMI1/KNR4 family protein [Bradyrhizobium xenonodulans]|uniref:SMI1/KNR4 family protein n=1 Tax=Bradyrhizobium xenonodulans TaxID=2736875 RepID=A0ABY7MQF5_9BRAD|nr:SMI1/KNR4 family protein [Bradyrhizobium xenonodulans]WBL80161.1 SMI1/KNR4 family protein [Bradyrhizobium xenonodulans]